MICARKRPPVAVPMKFPKAFVRWHLSRCMGKGLRVGDLQHLVGELRAPLHEPIHLMRELRAPLHELLENDTPHERTSCTVARELLGNVLMFV